jgi:hypothetical protein
LSTLLRALAKIGTYQIADTPEEAQEVMSKASAIQNKVAKVIGKSNKELTENIIQLTNITGPSGSVKQYLFNYINNIPDTTLKKLTQDKIVITGIKPIQIKEESHLNF